MAECRQHLPGPLVRCKGERGVRTLRGQVCKEAGLQVQVTRPVTSPGWCCCSPRSVHTERWVLGVLLFFFIFVFKRCYQLTFGCAVCGILVTRPGIEPTPCTVEYWNCGVLASGPLDHLGSSESYALKKGCTAVAC